MTLQGHARDRFIDLLLVQALHLPTDKTVLKLLILVVYRARCGSHMNLVCDRSPRESPSFDLPVSAVSNSVSDWYREGHGFCWVINNRSCWNVFFFSECSTPPCAHHTASTYPCSYPCGESSCSISPSLPYPSICPMPVHYPEPVVPPQCPMSCPSVCAPACNSLCCRSMIASKLAAEQWASQAATKQADTYDDDDDDEVI